MPSRAPRVVEAHRAARPSGRGTFLIGYDVEARAVDVTRPFLRRALEIHEATGVPATLFLCGRTIELNRDELRTFARHPLFDLQQHTYNHVLLKSVCIENPDEGVQFFRGGTLDQIRDEVRRTSDLLREEYGLECRGLTGPYAYYRGLADRPDILQVLWEEGIRFTRTWGRNEHDWQPVDLEVQPFWYAPQGFPAMLEVPIHGWQDIYLRKRAGWTNAKGFLDGTYPYMERAAAEGVVYSFCTHDHSSTRDDPAMRITESVLRHAQALGMATTTYAAFHAQFGAAQPAGAT
jgi:peptidoglycan/xylan/chitin deacetylase (PgdA/CDA1 family)